ncbi:glycosyltransferase [Candidatus Pseudothioglobus sp. Uisw_016]|uniref:glycosyltransferase n=1 Tax=Candidatus Pseudothioglobus sp. Uisw_016 TaxID=3230995 RepID=UPI003A87C9D1
MIKKPKILFIMYDGLTDPLGQSQVLSYIKHLSNDYSFDIIGYEKSEIYESQKIYIYKEIENLDIRWLPIKYHKKPPVISTIYDLYLGWKKAKKYGDIDNYDLIHCRSIVIGSVALLLKNRYKSKLIFDMRGWWADEKKESGSWDSKIYIPIYLYFKNLEKKLFKYSDHAISLTKTGYEEIISKNLKPANRLSVIPTCVDFNIFKPFDNEIRKSIRSELNIETNDTVIIYSGSLGGNYNIDIIINLYKASKKLNINTKILILSHTDFDYISSEIKKNKISIDDVRIKSCNYSDVHRYLIAGDIGVINYKNSYSTIGRSPTKMGEYWACGLPVLCEINTGDVDYFINKYNNSGYLIDTDDSGSYNTALTKILSHATNKNELRDFAMDSFDLLKGVAIYKIVYDKVLNGKK